MRKLAEQRPVRRHRLFPLALQGKLNGLINQLPAQPDLFLRMKLRLGHPRWPSSNATIQSIDTRSLSANAVLICSRYSCYYTATTQPCKDHAVARSIFTGTTSPDIKALCPAACASGKKTSLLVRVRPFHCSTPCCSSCSSSKTSSTRPTYGSLREREIPSCNSSTRCSRRFFSASGTSSSHLSASVPGRGE